MKKGVLSPFNLPLHLRPTTRVQAKVVHYLVVVSKEGSLRVISELHDL